MPRPLIRQADQIWQEPTDTRHPDLIESERLYGAAHTTGGRVLPGYRVAATPEQQEARLADPGGWNLKLSLPPSQIAVHGARAYNAAHGLGDPHQMDYSTVTQTPERIRAVGHAYDALPSYDKAAESAYAAMRDEVNQQYEHMTKNLGIHVQSVDHDPYPDVQHMMADVNNNHRLQVLSTATTGSHPFFNDDENDRFRAVHDFFGHAATGRGFDRHGEQAAFMAHSQMFSPQARPALASETMGQNASLILNGEFAPQKIALLPPALYQLPKPAAPPQPSAPVMPALPKAAAQDDDDYHLVAALKESFDIHRITDPLNRGLDRMTQAETEHLQAPFKAITRYDEYIQPTIHHWDPALSDDPDDSAQWIDNARSFDFERQDPRERAKQLRRKELGDTGRDLIEAPGWAFHIGAFTGYDDEDEPATPHIGPIKQYQPNHYSDLPWANRGMDDDQLGKATIRHHAATASARYILLPHWDPEQCMDILQDHDADMRNDDYLHHAAIPTVPPTNLGEAIDQVNKDTEKFKQALAVTPELMNQAKHGGFTLHDHVGDGPTSGYMVSLDKSTEHPLPMSQLTPAVIQDYVHKNAVKLQDPNAYLGGWLDNGTFYLDISHHVPDLYHATKSALGAHQLGIYDLNHGRTLDTEEAGWMTGNPQVTGSRNGRVPPSAQRRSAAGLPVADDGWGGYGHHPDHDWTQHRLGTDEDWGLTPRTGATQPPPPGELTNTGKVIGTHGGQLFHHGATGEDWLVKPTPPGKAFLADGDVAANHIATLSGVTTPPTFKAAHPTSGQPASMQLIIPAKDAFPGNVVQNIDKLSDDDMLTLQKHHALDWFLGNHDSHPGQYIRDKAGQLIGIDKAQSFKYHNNDSLHWNLHLNQYEPIHNTLWRNFAKGGRELADPRQPGPLHDYVKGLQSIPDEEITNSLTPYAQNAAQAGELGVMHSHPHLSQTPRFQPNDVQGFLHHVLERKHKLMDDLGTFYDRALAHRWTGTGIVDGHPAQQKAASLLASLLTPGETTSLSSGHGDLGYLGRSLLGSTYTVKLKLKDGSPEEALGADIFHDARRQADALAQKHQLTLKEKPRSPDDMGRMPVWLPAYHQDGSWVGNVVIDRPDLSEQQTPFGPHAQQYAYAAKQAAPITTLGHPPQTPTLPQPPKPPTLNLPSAPKLPQPGGEEPQTLTNKSGPASQQSWQYRSEHSGDQTSFSDQVNDLYHDLATRPGPSGGGGTGGGGGSAPSSSGMPPGSSAPSSGAPAPAGGDSDNWKARIRQNLGPQFQQYKITNPQVQNHMVDQMYQQMMTESGGRDVPQQIHDINTEKGTPAQGYYQYVPSTFEHAMDLAGTPGANIHDPDAQIRGVLPLEMSEGKVDPNTGFVDNSGSGVGYGHGWG